MDQVLFQTIMAKREKQISEDIKSMVFDIDFGTFEFQKNFYKKFLLTRPRNISAENKSQKQIISVPLRNKKYA